MLKITNKIIMNFNFKNSKKLIQVLIVPQKIRCLYRMKNLNKILNRTVKRTQLQAMLLVRISKIKLLKQINSAWDASLQLFKKIKTKINLI